MQLSSQEPGWSFMKHLTDSCLCFCFVCLFCQASWNYYLKYISCWAVKVQIYKPGFFYLCPEKNWWNDGNENLLAFITTVVCSVKWISDAETFHPPTGPFKIIPWHFHSCKCKCLLIRGDLKHVKNPGCSQLCLACYSISKLGKAIFYSSFSFHC